MVVFTRRSKYYLLVKTYYIITFVLVYCQIGYNTVHQPVLIYIYTLYYY